MTSKTFRRIIAATAVIASATLLAACAGGGGSGGGGGSTGGDDLGLPNLKGKTLNVSADWSGAEQKDFEAVIKVFEKATGATVNYKSLGNNVATVLGTQITGGNPPNVSLIPQPGLLKQLAADGSLKPLPSSVTKTVDANYSKTWQDLGKVDGTPYGVWFKGSNKSTVWYNTQLYQNAGIDEPKTWDEFTKDMQTLKDSGVSGLSIGADVGWPLTDWFENVYLRTAGGDMYDKLANHEIPWTDPSVTKALNILKDLWSADYLEPGGAQRSFGDAVIEVFGDNPKAATVYEGDFVATNIASDTKTKVGTGAKFYDFPSIDGSPASVVGGGNVAVAFKDDKATMAFMKFLAMPEAANAWIPLGGFTSPNQNADTGKYPDATSKKIAQALLDAKVLKFDMSDLAPSAFGGTEGQGEWQILLGFYSNPTDVAAVQQKLEAAAAAAYKS
jgi:ABC-type glycerol-3-phosphate transport system substrate-binding protein